MAIQGSFFRYELPPDKIAQLPATSAGKRSDAKLLHAAADGALADRTFEQLPSLLGAGDVLVVNTSRVLPCRFFAKKQETQSEIEVLLIRCQAESGGVETWEALARPMKKLKVGDALQLSNTLRAEVGERTDGGRRVLLSLSAATGSVREAIAADGLMPIPPYIRNGHSDARDVQWYQTVFANGEAGSVAAPTAGLHFTDEVLAACKERGVEVAPLTLHVGPASFLPLTDEQLAGDTLPEERYTIPEATCSAVTAALAEGRRVVAVGTTATRALESAWRRCDGALEAAVLAEPQETTLFIKPGFSFAVVRALVTNFHQPQTTHLGLVSAFIGAERAEEIYSYALAHDYRFLSYGDAMFLERAVA